MLSENVWIYLKDNASQTIQNHLEENRVPPVSTAAEESKQLLLPRTYRNIKTCFLILSVSLLFIYLWSFCYYFELLGWSLYLLEYSFKLE